MLLGRAGAADFGLRSKQEWVALHCSSVLELGQVQSLRPDPILSRWSVRNLQDDPGQQLQIQQE